MGAPGGDVRSLVSDPQDPNRLYLGTAEGILYRSDNGGRRWHRLEPGFPIRGCSLDEIAVDSRGVVYVGYWEVHGRGGGVARSDDGGRTFSILKGIQGESVRALALAPSDAAILAAGTLSGVFLSKNGGQSWARITPPGHADLRNVESLAFDPADAKSLYVGTWHLAWKTLDGGGSWAPAHQGIIDDSDVMTLTIERDRPQTVYATACTGIYRSTDAGAQWTKLRGIPYSSRRTRAFAPMGEGGSTLLAGTTEGLWVSEDAGATWRRSTAKDLVINAVVTLPRGAILLGTEGAGVLRSTDHGKTWAASNGGFSERFVSSLLFDSEWRRLVIAVQGSPHYAGVFLSPSVGGPWVRLPEGLEGRQVLSLAISGHTILAGTDDGVFMRPPEAQSWTRVATLIQGKEAHPRVTGLHAAGGLRVLAATSKGLIQSADGGRTWIATALDGGEEVADLAVSADDPDLIVAATRSGFFRSRDGGDSWKRVAPSLGVAPHALVFVPGAKGYLFATTSGGLFRSKDYGATWRRVNGGLPHSDLTGIAIHPNGRTLYVSDFTWGGVFRSVDRGSTWERVPTDGLGSERVWALGIDPESPDRLLASASAGGLHLLVTGTRVAARTRTLPAGMGIAPAAASPQPR